jgi:hypothetical protein
MTAVLHMAGSGVTAWLLAVAIWCAPARSQADPEVRLPPGTHRDASGQQISGRGLRETTEFLAAELARQGIAAQQIGPYAARGIELTRFLSQAPRTAWLAIHVVRISGKTLILFVPRGKSTATP